MAKIQTTILSLLCGTMLGAPACNNSGGFAKISNDLNELKSGQKDLMAKLEALEGKVGSGGGKAAEPKNRPNRPDPKATYKVPIGDAYTKGPETALVTIVEWSDFQCPFCKKVVPTMNELQKAYGDKIRIAFMHNPLSFHNRAMPAAMAAEAAGKQGKFWEMHDMLFENGRDLSDENFEKWAKELQLDVERFKKELKDPAITKKVKAQQSQGMAVGARGTPAFFVNGRFLSGAQPVEAFKTIIDEELKKAEKLVASGTPANKVYEKTIENGKTKV